MPFELQSGGLGRGRVRIVSYFGIGIKRHRFGTILGLQGVGLAGKKMPVITISCIIGGFLHVIYRGQWPSGGAS